MPSEKVLELDPKQIKVGWRARKDYGDVDDLAASIKAVGQLQPVVVRQKGDGYVIIAGLRRTRACRKLGTMVKAVVIKPTDEEHNLLLQLHENIKRKDFDRLEVGEGLKRMKLLYEKKHPEAKHGGKGRGRVPKSGTLAPSFVEAAARDLSVSKQTVYDLLSIADLPEEEKDDIAGAKTSRERNIAASKALSKVRKQRKVQKLEETAKKKAEERAEETKKVVRKGGKKIKIRARRKPAEQTIFLHPDDCFDFVAKAGVLGDGSVDLLCTDPPYGKQRSRINHKRRTMLNEEEHDWDKLDVGWVIKLAHLLDKAGSLLAFSPLEALGDYEMACEVAGLYYHGAIVWKKTNPAPAHRSVYVPSVEAIAWATKSKTGYTFKPWDNPGARAAHNLIEGPICGGAERLDHPTQKPLWLMKRLIEQHSTKGQVIFDPFCGVASTLVAAKQTGRICHGCEVSKKYVKIAVPRLQAM